VPIYGGGYGGGYGYGFHPFGWSPFRPSFGGGYGGGYAQPYDQGGVMVQQGGFNPVGLIFNVVFTAAVLYFLFAFLF
jgi:hypothetical protein